MSKDRCPSRKEFTCTEESAAETAPKLHSFLMKILYTLQVLQTQSRYKHGANIKEITREMKNKFKLNGDVHSQVETGVLQGVRQGFIIENDCKYLAVGALARLQLCMDSENREQLGKNMMDVFLQKSNYKRRAIASNDGSSDESSCEGRNKSCPTSNAEILQALNNLTHCIQASRTSRHKHKKHVKTERCKSASSADSCDSICVPACRKITFKDKSDSSGSSSSVCSRKCANSNDACQPPEPCSKPTPNDEPKKDCVDNSNKRSRSHSSKGSKASSLASYRRVKRRRKHSKEKKKKKKKCGRKS